MIALMPITTFIMKRLFQKNPSFSNKILLLCIILLPCNQKV